MSGGRHGCQRAFVRRQSPAMVDVDVGQTYHDKGENDNGDSRLGLWSG